MENKQLITFMVAAETLNFTQTAKMLNFAQSSVTAQIKSLEAELGTPLFERLGKRLVLTEAGQKFLLYAEKMIKLNEEAKMAIAQDGELSGTLIIGAQESQCTYRLPGILKEFKDRYPSVKLMFKPAHSDDLAREQLMNGMLDVAFIMDISKPEEALTIKPLIQEDIKLVASPSHPLASKSEIYLKDIEQETLLLTETGCSYRTLLENSCHSAKVYPINKFEFGSIEAIKQCVIAGIGIAALPTMVVEQDIKVGRIVELKWENNIPPIFTHIAWHKDKWMSPPLTGFIELTQQYFQKFQGQ
ncbi:LysR family transcriptional regulator [Rummeliibacillus stabekisii]|uniref:LysR family transcriptional regulator n=1 Tax=Rummeliibacillus stabekisii TaxID=241244 RepID=UPI001167C315|nr:LysR family transcriptional regulator [Rummeliibacillus stabekisii]MBB5171734.1 DNA-binding transcriptional LysR family regulator [Rummeliibacillus stabekisii]GEL06339.1 LysR family transcriptional regulator [Rummeliibacillus stabekisii]